MLTFSLLSMLTLAFIVVAEPIVIRDNLIRVSYSKKVNVTDPADILKQDQARAAFFHQRGRGKSGGNLNKDAIDSVGVQNQAVTYVANVNIGTPATSFSLLVDTGSSNTWVGAGKTFKKTSTSVQTSNKVAVTYGSGSFSGAAYTDTFSLGNGLTVKAQSFGVASKQQGFSGVDGVLGIGPVNLTIDTLSPNANSLIPTLTDNLFSQGVIPTHEVAISFEPTTSMADNNGELTFGGTDSSKFTGSITYTPITKTNPSNEYWGIDESVRYGASTAILSKTAGIVDTGTSLVLLATDAFKKYQKATGGVLDSATGLLKLTTAQYNNLQSLFFDINNVEFELTANAQVWPRSLNADINGQADAIYLIVNDLGTPSGEGLDFINGFAFLERFYTVFDTTNKRVGFATTPFTDATSN